MDRDMKRERWYKKQVDLAWHGQRLSLAVAQELFSSHDVDAGSKLLLRSLDPEQFPNSGQAIDFGCGYGVLGLAWQQAKPEWNVTLVDRDTLAVAFASLNAVETGLDCVVAEVGLGVDMAPEHGVDLVLWNVPGKAGLPVLQSLIGDVTGALAHGGQVALVVVNPLAEEVRDVLDTDTAMSIELDEVFAEHTVIHARRLRAAALATDPFVRGVFDREGAGFGVDEFDYDITPVIGIPEYDTYSFATQVTFDILRTVPGRPTSVAIFRPGQGHLAIVTANAFQPEQMVVADRDWLAVRASLRAIESAKLPLQGVSGLAIVDLIEVASVEPFDLCVLNLEEQVRNDVHISRLVDLEAMTIPGSQLLVGGTSSTVSRFLAFAAKTGAWKLRDRTKRSGASAARLERAN